MNRFIIIFISVTIFTVLSCNAAIYKGQRIFRKHCVACHVEKQEFIKSKTALEWKKLMQNSAKPLADLHLKNEKAKDSWEYFKSKRFSKKSKHLKQFLMEYAKGSGKVPACN